MTNKYQTATQLIIITLLCMPLSFCFIYTSYMHRPKRVQGDYYIQPNDIDGEYMYAVYSKRDVPYYGFESAKLIGVDGEYIYWTTFGKTIYRIDTTKNEQILIDKIPDKVKMAPVSEFYDALDR